ncbi:MAG: hypothetical protein KQI62_06350 [Deltaproteobacteria bacterium]|nr:hypothetical protein [Deltaproteobacteria bacterium]
MADVLLIDTNTTPFNEAFPVYPIGLDYLQGALAKSGLGNAKILDLTRAGGPLSSRDLSERGARSLALIKQAIDSQPWDAIGLSLRNIDSTYPTLEGQAELHHYLPQLTAYLNCVQENAASDTHVLLGGTGFSMMPGAFLEGRPDTWHGLVGPAESAFVDTVGSIIEGKEPPRLARQGGEGILGCLRNRELLSRYLELPIGEGTFGLRTKVGCGQACGYCPYPLINGPGQRFKDPAEVAQELKLLASVHWERPEPVPLRFMFADDIFNRPVAHAKAVLAAMQEEGIIPYSWHAYLDPAQIDREFLELVKDTNGWCRHEHPDGSGGRAMFFPFDLESGSDRMLSRLGKPYNSEELLASVEEFQGAASDWLTRGELDHVAFGFHLLMGYPGEDEASVAETCDLINRTQPHQVAVQLGVRVYPDTPLARRTRGELWREEKDLYQPTFVPVDENAVLGWLRQHLDAAYDRLSRKGNMLLISQGE